MSSPDTIQAWHKINQIWYKLSFGEDNSSLFQYRAGPLQKGDNHRNVRKEWGHLKILFLRTMKPETLNFNKNILK